MAIGQDGDRCSQLQGLGDAREPGQRRERIVERSGLLLGDIGSNGHVIGNSDEVKAQLLRLTCPIGE